MYSMNFAAFLFKKSKSNFVFIRILQILNIIFQISIVLLLIISFVMSRMSKKYETESYILKKSVFEQRNNKNIDETLRTWNDNYFKLSFIKKQIDKSSKYGIALKELGNYIPKDDLIYAVAFENSNVEFILKVNKNDIFKKEGIVNYSTLLKKQFENSLVFNKNEVSVEFIIQNEKDMQQQNIKYILLEDLKLFDNEIKNLSKNQSVQLLKVKMKLNERENN